MVLKRIVLLAIIMGSYALAAQAQVAGPTLAPSAVRLLKVFDLVSPSATFTPDNPAAMLWSERQRFGAGQINKAEVAPVGGTATNYKGNFAGFEKSSSNFAMGIETIKITDTTPGGDTMTTTNAALAAPLFDSVALGVGVNHARLSTVDQSVYTPTFGVSFMGGGVSLGLATGTDEFKFHDPTVPNTTESVRPVRMYGLGYNYDGTVMAHVEVNLIDRPSYPSLGGGDDSRITSALVEVQAMNIHVGYNLIIMQESNNTVRNVFSIFDLGYVQLDGWAFMVRQEVGSTTTVATSTKTDDYSSTSAAFALHF